MAVWGYFTPEEANALLPRLIDALKHMTEIKEKLDRQQEEMRKSVDGTLLDYGREKRKLNRVTADLYRQIEEIEALGCTIKDVDSCLVDFPAKMFDTEVWLCWRLGEPRVMYWHGKEEGFGSRKPLTGDISRIT